MHDVLLCKYNNSNGCGFLTSMFLKIHVSNVGPVKAGFSKVNNYSY